MDRNLKLLRNDFLNETTGAIDVVVYEEITRCFIGSLVKRGCKKRAKRIFSSVLLLLRFKIKEHPLIVIEQVLYNIAPKISLYVKKRGGSSYKLPHLISYKRALSIAIHSLIRVAKSRAENTIADRIVAEIIEIIKGKSTTLLKETADIHKTALYNRPFLNYINKNT